MIYEVAIIVRPEVNDEQLKTIRNIVHENIESVKGTVLINDDWGTMHFGQDMGRGIKRGRYLYCMYKSNGTINAEINRKLSIDENVIRFLIVNLGTERDEAAIVKSYANPLNQNSDVAGDEEMEKDRRMSSKRRSCWFSANKTTPDWKNPRSYSWLVNEFGKISPARVSGLRPHYQRLSNHAIKRGRFMGLVSHLSGNTAYRA